MIRLLSKVYASPIGVDIGSHCVKLVQLDGDRRKVIESVRWDLPTDTDAVDPDTQARRLAEILQQARKGRRFRGQAAVLCLRAPELFIQNLRIAKGSGEDFARQVFQEAAGRLPFPINEAQLRFLDTVDVRQGDALRREVIVLAVHEPVLERRLRALTAAGLQPVAIDAEPLALLRCYARQFRRDADEHQRMMFVNVGAAQTAVVITEGNKALFIKYIDVGGRRMDAAVQENLKMDLADAAALRRHNGDRRADQQDPEIARSISESVRPVIDHLGHELSMCVRYHSVAFRGQPLTRLVVSGGEASHSLVDALDARIDVRCELGEPLRSFEAPVPPGRAGLWDVAVGLALRERTAAR